MEVGNVIEKIKRDIDRELAPNPSSQKGRYVLKEVYRTYSEPAKTEQESDQRSSCVIADSNVPADPHNQGPVYAASKDQYEQKPYSDAPHLFDSVLANRNLSFGGPPIVQYNTYHIYQAEEKPTQLPSARPTEQHLDKIILAFGFVLVAVIFAFALIITYLLKKSRKKAKKKQSNELESENKSLYEKYREDNQSMSTSELGFHPQLRDVLEVKSMRSVAQKPKRNLEHELFATKAKENSSGRTQKSKHLSASPDLLVKTLDVIPLLDGQNDDFGKFGGPSRTNSSADTKDTITSITKDFDALLKASFGEKVTLALPELNKNAEHSKSFITSPDLPEYETGRFKNTFYAVKEIGRGSFGAVFRAFHKLEEKVYAIKVIEFTITAGQDPRMDSTLREIYAMSDLKHENVVRYITCWLEKEETEPSREASPELLRGQSNFGKKRICEQQMLVEEQPRFDLPSIPPMMNHQNSDLIIEFKADACDEFDKADNDIERSVEEEAASSETISLYIQMEFCKGLSLSALIETGQFKVSRFDAYLIFKQVVEGVAYIHSKGLVHRDLKPGNIFVDTSGVVKIGDFGLVIHQAKIPTTQSNLESLTLTEVRLRKKFEKTKNPEEEETEFAGSPLYAPPEANEGEQIADSSGDIYSIGIVLYELLGEFQTKHKKVQEIVEMKKQKRTGEKFKAKYPVESRLIDRLISFDPHLRPKAAEIKNLEEYREWMECVTAHMEKGAVKAG